MLGNSGIIFIKQAFHYIGLMAKGSKIILILYLVFSLVEISRAQRRPLIFTKPFVEDNQVEFKHYTTEDGLSNDKVTRLLQDNNGYIWIATLDGLNKYDGKSFISFRISSESGKPQTSSVFTSLAQSREGDVFAGSERGLFKYDRDKNQLVEIQLMADSIDFTGANIRNILCHDDTLWVLAYQKKLIVLDLKTMKVDTTFYYLGTDQPYYYYHSLYMDKENNLWFADRNMYPRCLNPSRNKITHFLGSRDDFSKKREDDVSGFLEDSKGRFWVSGSDGVYLLDRKMKIFKKFIRPTTWCMAQDTNGIYWFGTGMGLLKYDEENGEIISYRHQKDNPRSISSNNVYHVLFDKAGNIWLATSNGVDVYSPPKYPFGKYTHLAGIENSPGGNSITAVTEGEQGNLWVGYDKEGLDCFDRQTENFQHFCHDKQNKNSLAGDRVADIYRDTKGKLWIGLWQGIGFNIYNTKTNKFKLITYDKTSYQGDWYNDFIEAENGEMFVGFWGAKGLSVFDENSNRFVRYYGSSVFPRFCCRLITRIEKDDRNNIWFGTTDCGVYSVNYETEEKSSYYAGDSSGLKSDEIKDMLFDNDTMWVLNDYLQAYDANKNRFETFGETVFPQYSLKAMLRDDNGIFWISTENKGLLVFNVFTDSIEAHYFKHDGLQSNKFNDARFKLSTGELFFGGQQGFNLFDPKAIKCSKKLPRVFYGKFSVFGKVYYFETSGLQSIFLEPDEDTFTIDLLNDDMINPEQYKYEVMLRGFDKGWVEVSPKTREIRYTAVPFGSYELLYRISDSQGRVLLKPATLGIEIATPYYRSWWFYGLIFIMVVTIIAAFLKIRYDELKERQRNLDLRERLFRLQVNPHFLFNSLIAIQNYILNHEPKDAGLYLSNFARFFRIMLESSQTEAILLETEIEMLTLYLGLQQIRYPDKFDFTFEVDDELPEDLTLVPAMMVQPILENAIEHGFRDKTIKGVLVVRFIKMNHFIRFEALDNGIGLTASRLIKSPGKTKKHKSSAISIIEERARVLSKKYHFPMLFEIEEVVIENSVNGTIVRINLPLIKDI